MVREGIILGHKITRQGIDVDKAKIDIIEKLPPPMSVKGIKSFLGHAIFYRRFIKDFSKISKPLNKLLEKDTTFNFDEKCLKAFDNLKSHLLSTLIIVTPDWGSPFKLIYDASDFVVGAIIGQRRNKIFHPIYYEKKELLAIIFTLNKFFSYLVGTKVTVFSDHSPIKYFLTKKDVKPRYFYSKNSILRFKIERGRKPSDRSSVQIRATR
ncbi:Retrovirus-related Pol polyprotein from transposon 17.6 [Gossypium australe]|uniref:Retrovirus-related Pol polyprotein from transposon 17.6 n=1 Tax=Gossypium australe TaxID=47621 RepID=A0A5B6W771_9ROSI|nr:Retrovirus-related Pol polyprotein from transposon 17.6 [Gossypium australe]